MGINESYTKYYLEKKHKRLYPTEFVVRAFLAKYPRLNLDKSKYLHARILDLGFGDGRNSGFLCDQGFEVHGVEISDDIVSSAQTRLSELGYEVNFVVGRNRAIPFKNDFFDYLLACHACYYLDEGDDFTVNLREISRVLKTDGTFVGSIPMEGNHYFSGAEDLGNGIKRIRNDYYGVRNGSLVMGISSEDQLVKFLSPYFKNIRLGMCDNDFWGVREKVMTFVCEAV